MWVRETTSKKKNGPRDMAATDGEFLAASSRRYTTVLSWTECAARGSESAEAREATCRAD